MRSTTVIVVLVCLMSAALAAQEAKVTQLMSKDLADFPARRV